MSSNNNVLVIIVEVSYFYDQNSSHIFEYIIPPSSDFLDPVLKAKKMKCLGTPFTIPQCEQNSGQRMK